jgi:hypothetical protein
MATNTYVPIATQTISGTGTASVVFNSFSGYTDILLVCSAKSNSGSGDTLKVAVNTSSSISRTYMIGNGTSATSGRQSGEPVIYVDDVPNNSSSSYVIANLNFINYSNTTTYKTVLSRANNASSSTRATVYLVPSTSAITTLTMSMASSANLGDGSTFTLYGIAAQPVATAKASGGTITYAADGYTYHAFTSSGTFTPSVALTADVLVVAGGGGGASNLGGGGGAGGLLFASTQSFAPTTGYGVTVGAGGAGGIYSGGQQTGANGINSSVIGGAISLTAIAGGGGDGQILTSGSGGSSGGTRGAGTVGTATSGQGNLGATGLVGAVGGGGGGAGTAGTQGSAGYNGGAGGLGLATYSQWGASTSLGQNVSGTYYFAGGGGGAGYSTSGGTSGGTGGVGGGGVGKYQTGIAATNGTVNTGGGGGATVDTTGGAGGSGIVIIRYAS